MSTKEIHSGMSLGDFIKKNSSNQEFQDTKNIITEIEQSHARETAKFYKNNAEAVKAIRENFYELEPDKFYTPEELESHFHLPFSELKFLLEYEHLKLKKLQKKKNQKDNEYIESYQVLEQRGHL